MSREVAPWLPKVELLALERVHGFHAADAEVWA